MVKLLFLSHPGSGTLSFSWEAGWFGAGLLPPPSLQELRRLGQWFTQTFQHLLEDVWHVLYSLPSGRRKLWMFEPELGSGQTWICRTSVESRAQKKHSRADAHPEVTSGAPEGLGGGVRTPSPTCPVGYRPVACQVTLRHRNTDSQERGLYNIDVRELFKLIHGIGFASSNFSSVALSPSSFLWWRLVVDTTPAQIVFGIDRLSIHVFVLFCFIYLMFYMRSF